MYHAIFGHVTLTLGGFLGEDVPFERFLEGNEPGGGYLEALLGAGVCFNFWHCITGYSYSLLAPPRGRRTFRALWEMSVKRTFLFRAAKIRELPEYCCMSLQKVKIQK